MVNRFRYAKTVNEQNNPNVKRNRWANIISTVSMNGSDEPLGVAWGYYSKTPVTGVVSKSKKTTYEYVKPYTVTGHNFNLDIPNNAYITNVKFTARLKSNKGILAPIGVFCIYGNAWASRKSNTGADKTGWYNGLYRIAPSKKLSSSYQNIEYNMTGSVLTQAGLTPEKLNDAMMGVDLIFQEYSSSADAYLKWVRCDVTYELPNHVVTFDKVTSVNNPYEVLTGERFTVKATYKNNSKANDGLQVLDVKLPFGTVLESYSTTGECSFSSSTMKWTVNGNAGKTSTLTLNLIDYTIGDRELNIGRPHIDGKADVKSASFYYYGIHYLTDGYEVITSSQDDLRVATNGCIHVKAVVYDDNGVVKLNSFPDEPYSIYLNENETDTGVTLEDDGTNITLNVPESTLTNVSFDVCFIPETSGERTWLIKNDTPLVYYVKDPYTYVFTSKETTGEDIFNFNVNPVTITTSFPPSLTSTELGVAVIDCSSDERDSHMIMSQSNLKANVWEVIPYIASVPVQHAHFDPETEYSNDEVKESYKTKKYTGKKGVIEEKISLNIRVSPQDATTLEGYVEMDKPIPLNLVPTAFEGDSLNHRGWAELSKVKITQTNRMYYKVEADVDYITHNINTKFDIVPNIRVISDPLPNVLAQIMSNGDPLSNGMIEVVSDDEEETTDFFNVDTDGTYDYDSESIEDLRNMFSIDGGQHVLIKSNEILSQNVDIVFSWMCSKLSVDEANLNFVREFRLVDADTKNAVFKYDYHDLSFDDDFVSCTVTGTKLTESLGSEQIVNETIDLRMIGESEVISEDSSDDYELDDEFKFGSTIRFSLNNNILSIIDEGYNGREISVMDIDLSNGRYYFEAEFKNNNTSLSDKDILLFVDAQVLDTVLQAQYTDMYSKMIVSPFPVADKRLIFTRKSSEGTLYYFYDDGYPFKYRVDPFYQYHQGTELKSREGVQLFNLNNSHEIVYIQNGLVRLGFNRFNGQMYLSKFDPSSGEYIRTNIFELGSDVTFDMSPISDDRIDITVNNESTFTIWRGHPYIMVKHPNLDINFIDRFSSVFGEVVDGDKVESLSHFLLLNTDNLLPSCVGSNDKIKSDCVTVLEPDDVVLETSMDIGEYSNVHVGDVIHLNANAYCGNDVLTGDIAYLVNGEVVYQGADGVDYSFDKADVYRIQAIYVGDDDYKYAISDAYDLTVDQIQGTGNALTDNTYNGVYKLEVKQCASTMHYMDNSPVVFQLTRGGRAVPNKVVEVDRPSGTTTTLHTDANGLVTVHNNQSATIGSHTWQCRFYDYQNEDMSDKTLVVVARKKITMKKAVTSLSLKSPSEGVCTQNSHAKYVLTRNYNGKTVAFANQKISVRVNNGAKITRTTNSKGEISIKMTNKASTRLTLKYLGNAYHEGSNLISTIKVR